MTQKEVVEAMKEELEGKTISQGYLSQLESSKRVHLTASSRDLLARFFKVHPGYLVSDPDDYSTNLLTEVDPVTTQLDAWLTVSPDEWRLEPSFVELLQRLSETEKPLRYIVLFHRLVDLPLEELAAIVDAVTSHQENSLNG
jgi:transcriptional regulator with XRE-family HTH domain